MHKKFNIINRTITITDDTTSQVDFYINPTESEKSDILKNIDSDEHALSSALDADEIPRVEFEKDYTFIICKHPNANLSGENFQFKVSSMGVLLTKDKITIILADEYELYGRREFTKVDSLFDYFIKIFSYIIKQYVEHVKAINLISKELQDKVNTAFENKYLIQMMNLSESLIYYINSIGANNSVFIKLKNNAKKLGFSQDEIDSLEDIIIENNQCYKQAEIYSTILSGLMDARGTIVNNNMNVMLKKLTMINVIFLPLNLIASIGGMSEFSMMTEGLPWQTSYLLFIIGMIIMGVVTALALTLMNRNDKMSNYIKFPHIKLFKKKNSNGRFRKNKRT